MRHVLGDWGTSRLRLWLMEGDHVAGSFEGPGIGDLPRPPAEVLADAIKPWIAGYGELAVSLCGMAGSRQGMVEAPYVACPATQYDWARSGVSTTVEGARVRIAAGLSRDPPDIMRGEETQVFGAMRLRPNLARGRHVVITPGTHSKWILVADGALRAFHTFPTGEVFARLRTSSLVLDDGTGEGGDEGFAGGLAEGLHGDAILAGLFAPRSGQLLKGRTCGWAEGYLSGLLIGREIAEGRRLLGGGAVSAVIGGATLTKRYHQALLAAGVDPELLDGEACARAGLSSLLKGG